MSQYSLSTVVVFIALGSRRASHGPPVGQNSQCKRAPITETGPRSWLNAGLAIY